MGKGRPTKCPACGSSSSRSRGYKYYAGGKKAKDRQCKSCGRTISRQGEAAESCDMSSEAIRAKGEAKMAKKDKMRSASAVKRDGNLRRAPDAKARKGSRNCEADDIQEMITALRSQLSHVKAQTAFLDLKCTEMRPDDQVSLYGFMDAQEQLKIEKSLLAGHAWMLQDMLAERKIKIDMYTRRLLNEIRNNAA